MSNPQITITIKDAAGTNQNSNTVPAVGVAGTPSADVTSVQGVAGGIAIPISVASLPLPAGAATAAKQPAIGTAGTPSVDVTSVQGVAGGTAIPISVASLPLPAGAATAAKQPAIGTAGTPSVDVTSVQGVAGGTAIPISAASLPLPAGASTAAKQPAIGTAGTPSVDVVSIQGVAGGTAIPISAASLPLPTGAATALNQGRSTTPSTPTLFTATTDTAAIAANANRKRFSVFCDVNNLGTLYVLIGAGTCSSVLMTIALTAGGYYDFDTTDQIRACFSNSGNTAYFQEHA